ncbi:tRNA (adenosine(37)-N6)-dimethylallyltransferase MiaA [Roseomonas indoligenes]|uniref:tRNA dimethylallyltransferase n=1 Tax=Roseomonas indoligenes TaxID=2820811 RepID=A0A940MY54_9PROT|nr:tRNA (adenosine(37)-N6)-dimethylallyltransferase MiaA [Pararoseomonas indoligenes]MBP0492601.1 tRNA (adenosine(37)-N6)-dimethylallyltransferase MiaA [Pararoseomonas indoligenes]
MEQPEALLIAGPTASGKSALALALARRLGGVVINADSMQVYRELRVLTARPTPEEEVMAPHALYGVHPAARAASVAWWRDAALAEMAKARRAGLLPILCGGTGLYFRSLTHGLSEMPPVPDWAREEARRLLAEDGPAALHARLAAADPESAARLRPSDSQRLARAWEVWRATGRGIARWQADAPATGPAPYAFRAVLIDPPRDALREAIGVRWAAMLRAGAMDEVRALRALELDPALPAMRAHGVPELSAVLEGRLSPEEAGRRATLAVGQYTKRQATWFRHQTLAAPSLTHIINARIVDDEQLSECQMPQIISFIKLAG